MLCTSGTGRRQQRQIGADVGRHHDDVGGLKVRGFGAFAQQGVAQRFELAQARVAGMYAQAAVVQARVAMRARG